VHNPDDSRALTAELMAAVESGRLDPPEPTAYPLDRAAAALADLEGRRVTGKIVLVP
jgi:NADPH2:quinone reductase